MVQKEFSQKLWSIPYTMYIRSWTSSLYNKYSGADPGFQVRGGALKTIVQSGGRREHFWCISCEKSRFYAKKSYFFQLRREKRKFLGVFRVKNRDFTPKNLIFSNSHLPPWYWHTVKVLIFVGTNFCGFYKMLWSMGSWICGFKYYRQQSMEYCISLDFNLRGLSQGKLEPPRLIMISK